METGSGTGPVADGGAAKGSRAPRLRGRRRSAPAASERAYDVTKHRILRGSYEGGSLISEGEIADSLHISRTPVREAFLRLQSEGLLKLYPKKGAMVVPVSNHEIEMVFETRLVLERFAIEKAMRNGQGPRVADQIDSIIAKQHGAVEAGKTAAFADLDREIHHQIMAAAGNEILAELYDSLRDRQIRMGKLALYLSPARAEHIMAEHQELAQLFREESLEKLLTKMAEHIQGTRDALVS